MGAGSVAIRIQDLSCSFGDVRAVDGLSLEVPAGAIFGFLGPNGAGKTTTIQLLLGLLEPTGGSAEVLGFDTRTRSDEIRARSGALLEHHGLYEQLSADENLEFYARVWRLPAAERSERTRALLEPLGLWERRADRVGTWSRGMKQQLALARALLHHPRLVFLDEPTAGLDVAAAVAVREQLANLAEREGLTVFLTTHNMSEAERLCSHVAVIGKGRLLAQGRPDELRTGEHARIEVVGTGFHAELLDGLRARPDVAAARLQAGRLVLELDSGGDTGPLVTWMVNAGVQVQELRRERASLEEVFLTLTREEELGT